MSDAEVCASTENGDLTPYSQEYEGYMGNYDNTLVVGSLSKGFSCLGGGAGFSQNLQRSRGRKTLYLDPLI